MPAISSLSHQLLRSIDKDHRKAAETVNLSYVNDLKEGIRRHKKAKSFSYTYKGKQVSDTEIILRIKKLAIPPSWSGVWICATSSGHIQATGIDLNGRKQYRYHAAWNMLRNETKFHRLREFGRSLPMLRKKMNRDLAVRELTAEKVIATTISIMEQTSIRIGNNGYEKLYGSYGLTTLKDKHVTISKGKALFCFTGKKGIEQKLSLNSKKLAMIIKQCRDIPGKELFQFYEEDGSKKSIDSGMVNHYIKEGTNGDFSAKDFRTWAGSLAALQAFRAAGDAIGMGEIKKTIVSVLDEVSRRLGNTRSVCRKYYVHPLLLSLYEENKLIVSALKAEGKGKRSTNGLSKDEGVLMKLLEHYQYSLPVK